MSTLTETILKIFTRDTKDTEQDNGKPLSRSEKEAQIKDKAGLVINVFALLLAVNAWYGGKLSSTVLNNTIAANDTWAFYQAKAIKQTQYQIASEQTNDIVLKEKYKAKAASYESEPDTGEGKLELRAKAQKLEEGREQAKHRSPWIGYAGTAFQLAIVILSASILAVSMRLFYGSILVALIGIILASQGVFLWLPQ